MADRNSHFEGSTIWTEERKMKLKELYESTFNSTAEIARSIGAHSKNACVGMAYRMGLKRPISGSEKQRRSGTLTKKARAARKRPVFVFGKPDFSVYTTRQADFVSQGQTAQKPLPKPSEGISILEIEDGQCREPLGTGEDGLMWFCGKPVKHEDSSFCGADNHDHHGKNHVLAVVRR